MIQNYNDLPLGKYLEILDIPTDLPEMDFKVRVIALLADVSEDTILDQPLPRTMEQARSVNFLTQPLPKADGKRIASSYRLGDLELVPVKDVRKWTTAQFVDFQTFIRDQKATALPELYSCVLVPKGHTYGNGYDIADVHRAIREHLPVTAAQEISAFFLRQFGRLSRSILISSLPDLRKMARTNTKAKEMQKKVTELLPLLKSGDGWLM